MKKKARRIKGEGGLYQRADGMWIGAVDLGWTPEGKRRRKVVSSRTQAGALEKLRKVRTEVDKHGDLSTESLTVETWCRRWLDEVQAPSVRPRSLDANRQHVERYIVPAIGRIRLDRLTPAHVARLRDFIVKDGGPDKVPGGLSSTTARHAHRTLSKALKDAELWGLVPRNVAGIVKAPAKATSDRVALSADQAKVLMRASSEKLAARWTLAVVYGMRQGEALGLTWDHVDLDAGTIDLAWQLQALKYRHGHRCACKPKSRAASCPSRTFDLPADYEVRQLVGARHLTRPKTTGSRRVVPMIPLVHAALTHHRSITASDPSPHGLLFANADGSPIWPNRDSEAWHDTLDRAELPSVPLHTARHTAATLLLELGVDAATIAAILGHSDVVTTRGYQHVDLALQRAALERLGRLLES